MRIDRFAATAALGAGFEAGLSEALGRLRAAANDPRDSGGRCLRLTIFVSARDEREFGSRRLLAGELVSRLGHDSIPWSVIAQPPDPGIESAVYAELLPPDDSARVLRREFDGKVYTAIERPDGKEIFAGGLTSDAADSKPEDMAAAFGLMAGILRREGLGFGDVVRQWGYVRGFLRVRVTPQGPRQVYQEFNDARRRAYGPHAFHHGYPAATGIGSAFGGTVLEFTAVSPRPDSMIVPLSNPLQRDAHRYRQHILAGAAAPGADDKAAPLFERAKLVGDGEGGEILVSGTAAIRAETTVPGDALEQARTTVENIRALVSPENLRAHRISSFEISERPSYVRAYVKRREDIPAVRAALRAAFEDGPAHYLAADVCRDDLLIEIEGVFAARTASRVSRA